MRLGQNRRRVAVSTLGILSVLAASCGSSSSSASATATTGASGGTATTGAKADPVANAKAEIAKYAGMPTFTAPGPAIDASKLKGKKVSVVMNLGSAPSLVTIADGIKQAGQLLGIQVQVYDGQGILSTMQQDVLQSITQHSDAIILDGEAGSFLPSAVAAANAAKIPLIDVLGGQPVAGTPGGGYGEGVFAGAGPSWMELGRLMADTAIVKSSAVGINASIITFNNPLGPAVIKGIDQVFSGCSNCHVLSTQDIEPQYWGTKVTGSVTSLIAANPKLNYIFPVSDTPSIFATAGVSQAGATGRVSVATAGGAGPATVGLVQKGPILVTDSGYSTTWAGWGAMDQALRAMSGMKPGNPSIPLRYIDKSNIAGVKLTSDMTSVYGDAYIAGFKKLWGLG